VAFQPSQPLARVEQVSRADDMGAVVMPLGPNPLMGGFSLQALFT